MKRLIPYVFILFAAGSFLYAQPPPDAPELTRLLNEFLAGAGRNDAAVHDRFWAEDLIYTRSAGTRTNKEEIMKGVRSAPAAKPGDPVTVYSASDVRVQQYGEAAVVAFLLVGQTTRFDGTKTISNNLNTGTFIKRKGRWQVVAWQSTIVPKPAPEVKTTSQSPSADSKPVIMAASLPPISQPPSNLTAESRTYRRGPRGGCYYLTSSGKKVYVDHGLCK